MPICEYRCQRCGQEFERFVLSSRAGRVICPTCGSADVSKMLSTFASGGRSSAGGATSCQPSG